MKKLSIFLPSMFNGHGWTFTSTRTGSVCCAATDRSGEGSSFILLRQTSVSLLFERETQSKISPQGPRAFVRFGSGAVAMAYYMDDVHGQLTTRRHGQSTSLHLGLVRQRMARHGRPYNKTRFPAFLVIINVRVQREDYTFCPLPKSGNTLHVFVESTRPPLEPSEAFK